MSSSKSYQRPDHYTRKAQAQGYAARSVFKLDEIDARFRVVPRKGPPGVAIDLGCFPGSWSRWLQEQKMRVIGVDLREPDFAGDWIVASALDVPDTQLLERAGGPVDLLVSDMAPSTTGSRFTDHCRQIELARRALSLTTTCLKPGAHFVAKVFDGEDAPAFVREVEAAFKETRRLKPDATRDRSVEFFVVGFGRR